jgi:hypothetical protein
MMKRSTLVLAVCALLFIGISGCDTSKKEAAAPAPPMSQAQQPDMAGGLSLSGKVVETMDSGGYTYVNLENNGKRTWVAMPQTKVKVGQDLSCKPGMEMRNFTSKTLNRTFDSIIFSGGVL